MKEILAFFLAVVVSVIFANCDIADARPHGGRGMSIEKYQPPICFRTNENPSPETLQRLLEAKDDFFPRKVILVREEASRHTHIAPSEQAYDLLQAHVREIIRRLKTPRLDEPKYSLNQYGWDCRNYYHLIICYAKKLNLTLEDFGVTNTELRQAVKARIIETDPKKHIKELRKESLKWLSLFDQKPRDRIRPIALWSFRQDIANLDELAQNGEAFGITPQELGLWDGEMEIIKGLVNEDPPFSWRLNWRVWLMAN